jgi:glutamyl-tRNA reductase
MQFLVDMVIKMKQVSTSKPFFSSEMIAEATQAASSIVEDKDNPRTTEADWSHAIVSYSMDDLNQQLTQKRTRGLQKKPTKKHTITHNFLGQKWHHFMIEHC